MNDLPRQKSVREVKQVSYDFTGDVVLITGGARGQGRQHGLEFAKAGASVVLVDTGGNVTLDAVYQGLSDQAQLDSAVAECEALGADAMGIAADVRSGEQMAVAVEKTIERFGKIDILVCNAGVASFARDVANMTERAWDEIVDTNLKGVFLTARSAIPHMIEAEHGKVVITGSIQSFIGLPKTAHYNATKFGVVGFAKALALEVAKHGINVNVVCPGSVNTGMVETMDDPEMEDGYMQEMSELSGSWNIFQEGAPMMEPNEITQAVLWLSSDASAFVTGTTLVVDAGYLTK